MPWVAASYGRMEFAAKLKKLMARKRFSQEEVAKHINVSQNLVSLWTRGKSIPDMGQAAKLAAFLDVSLDYLADDTQDEPETGLSPAEAEILSISRTLGYDLAKARLLAIPGASGMRLSDEP